MTQTWELDQLVQIEGEPGEFFWITRLPAEGSDVYTLFGGRKVKGGRCMAGMRSVHVDRLKVVKGKATTDKAIATRRVIEEAMAAAPKPHSKKAGAK